MQKKIVVCYAKRSAIGKFMGSLSNVPAHEISAQIIKDLLKETKLDPNDIDEVIMGQVLQALAGQNSARQTAIAAGIPVDKTAMTINQVCGSGLRSVMIAYQSIMYGSSKIIIAGGHENMTMAPHAICLRDGIKMGSGSLKDTMIEDGLMDVFSSKHMGITAENVARKFGVSRSEQDKFALSSQQKAFAASEKGLFETEIVPIIIKSKKGDTVFKKDEYIRGDTTLETLTKLKTAFDQSENGTVTAGNASGINDGAAVLLVMEEQDALARGISPIATIVSAATTGVAPDIMGIGPVGASKKALSLAGWRVQDLDLIEANEAFAAQAIAVDKEMGWDKSKVNINGGAIAVGHPIGASGARIATTLLHSMQKNKEASKGLATLCIGGGMGIAMCFEKYKK